ncbi:hypothetical protein [Rhodovastum atsumiense]|uniref:Uncharacterized protein n=1 Tax=Rhodovastum atsumiense TaxID=504468 RepID=A0A5M6J533_9PROT|nr:hypothetical protein [Rhodovastum atsumiense]KAA5614745.1 hypothetical protein F1189_01065 [Rhodovastum atsumiense]
MSFGDIVVGVSVALLGLLGLLLVSGALDSGMYVFGLSLFGFAVLFDFGLIKKYFDLKEAAAKAGVHG